MKKLKEYKELLNEEINEKLLKEALEKSKHNCLNCKWQKSKLVSSNEYYTDWDYFCSNKVQIYQLNDELQSLKHKFPNLVTTYGDYKEIGDRYHLCKFFEHKE